MAQGAVAAACGAAAAAAAGPPSRPANAATAAPTLLEAARHASSVVSGGGRRWEALSDEALAREVEACRRAVEVLAASLAALGGGGGGSGGAAGLRSAAAAPPPPSSLPGATAARVAEEEETEDWHVPPSCIPIHADVRTFDWARLAAAAQFDVVLCDPPWQLATAAPTRGVTLSYAQLSDADIRDRLPIPTLQRRGGFLFVWVINAKYKFTLDLFDAWGYQLVDEIVWVKSTVNRRLAKSHGYYLQHAKETCLVGFKAGAGTAAAPPSPPMPWELAVAARKSTAAVGSDVIFAERRGQSQKPAELYALIEELVPAGRYVEIFARKNNLRNGWVSIGNEVTGVGGPAAAAQREAGEEEEEEEERDGG